MTNKKRARQPIKVPVMPLAFTLFLIAGYIYVVLVPAFSKANGIPDDIFPLIAQPVLIIAGVVALIWGRSWFDRKAAGRK